MATIKKRKPYKEFDCDFFKLIGISLVILISIVWAITQAKTNDDYLSEYMNSAEYQQNIKDNAK